jgi:hypothetical protein
MRRAQFIKVVCVVNVVVVVKTLVPQRFLQALLIYDSRSHCATWTFGTSILQMPQPTRLHWLANIFLLASARYRRKTKSQCRFLPDTSDGNHHRKRRFPVMETIITVPVTETITTSISRGGGRDDKGNASASIRGAAGRWQTRGRRKATKV